MQTEVTAAGFPANPNLAIYPHGWIANETGEFEFTYEIRDADGVTLICGLPYADTLDEVTGAA